MVFFCTAEATTINRVTRGGIQFFQNLATRQAYVNNGLQASNLDIPTEIVKKKILDNQATNCLFILLP